MDSSRRSLLLRHIETSIPANQYSPVTIQHIPEGDVQDTINIVWDVSKHLRLDVQQLKLCRYRRHGDVTIHEETMRLGP